MGELSVKEAKKFLIRYLVSAAPAVTTYRYLVSAAPAVTTYLGRVGGEKHFSPPTQSLASSPGSFPLSTRGRREEMSLGMRLHGPWV